jgi:hypothetical protein
VGVEGPAMLALLTVRAEGAPAGWSNKLS